MCAEHGAIPHERCKEGTPMGQPIEPGAELEKEPVLCPSSLPPATTLAFLFPLLPSVIHSPQSSQGELKKNNCDHVTPLFVTFQQFPIVLRMKLELSTRAGKASPAWLPPPSLISSPVAPLGSPGCPQTPQVPLR